MTKRQFHQKVLEEAYHLRDNTTEGEKAKLIYEKFSPIKINSCIYGLMTGYSLSKRAIELFPKELLSIGYTTFEDWIKWEKKNIRVFDGRTKFFTPLEVYTCLKDAKVREIFQFIKKESNALAL